MRTLMLAVIISASALAPLSAHAGEQLMLVQQGAPIAKEGIDRGKAFAIGAGIAIGATAGAAFTFQGAMVVGAVAGGLLGAWWYGDRSDYATLDPRKK